MSMSLPLFLAKRLFASWVCPIQTSLYICPIILRRACPKICLLSVQGITLNWACSVPYSLAGHLGNGPTLTWTCVGSLSKIPFFLYWVSLGSAPVLSHLSQAIDVSLLLMFSLCQLWLRVHPAISGTMLDYSVTPSILAIVFSWDWLTRFNLHSFQDYSETLEVKEAWGSRLFIRIQIWSRRLSGNQPERSSSKTKPREIT